MLQALRAGGLRGCFSSRETKWRDCGAGATACAPAIWLAALGRRLLRVGEVEALMLAALVFLTVAVVVAVCAVAIWIDGREAARMQ
jgi:hypothetical protein